MEHLPDRRLQSSSQDGWRRSRVTCFIWASGYSVHPQHRLSEGTTSDIKLSRPAFGGLNDQAGLRSDGPIHCASRSGITWRKNPCPSDACDIKRKPNAVDPKALRNVAAEARRFQFPVGQS